LSDVIDYLIQKGVKYTLQGPEAVIHCPNCGLEKLSLNINTGLFQCFHCKARDPNGNYAKGHISKLKEVWGDIVPISPIVPNSKRKVDYSNFANLVERYHHAIFESKNAQKYLLKRGFNEEDVKNFKFGFTHRFNQDWLVIPSFEKGVPVLIKYRKLPPDTNTELAKYIREKDSKSVLWNCDALDEYEEIIVVEGELDAATLKRNGYDNVVGATGGAGTLLPEWYDKLINIQKITLIMDSDSAGQTAAREVWSTRLGGAKCWNVLLPEGYDINKYFLEHTKEEFNVLLSKASQFKIKGVVSLDETLQRMYEKSQNEGEVKTFPLPWPSINRLLEGGLRRGKLTVIGGQASSGKTTLALQICYHFSKYYNIPSLYFCLEMDEIDLATKIIQLDRNLAYKDVNYADALLYAMDLEGLPIYLGYHPRVTPDMFYHTLKEVRNRYGIGLAVFDNLQLLVRTDSEAEIAKASGMFKLLSSELDLLFLLISQPRKLNEERNPTFDDLKGTSAISQDADQVMLIHRRRKSGEEEATSFDSIAQIIMDKARFASGGRAKLELIGDKSRFDEIKKEGG